MARPRARSRWLQVGLLAVAAVVLAACGSSGGGGRAESGQYRVQKGDTLFSIARKHGQSVDSLRRMNQIANPNRLEVGQVLRVSPQAGAAPAPAKPAASASRNTGPAVRTPPAAPRPPPSARRIALQWPAPGKSTARGNGVFIVNSVGTAITAAAAGSVVYAGDGLPRYGNLVIVRHDANFLTVYAHNRSLAVAEGARVRQGQKIAEMGSSGAAQVGLYFELRDNGNPVDALRMLPAR